MPKRVAVGRHTPRGQLAATRNATRQAIVPSQSCPVERARRVTRRSSRCTGRDKNPPTTKTLATKPFLCHIFTLLYAK